MTNFQKKIFSIFLAILFALTCLHQTGMEPIPQGNKADLQQLVSILRNLTHDIEDAGGQADFKRDFKLTLDAFYLAAGLKTTIKKAELFPGPGKDLPMAPEIIRLTMFNVCSDRIDQSKSVCESFFPTIDPPPPRLLFIRQSRQSGKFLT